VRAATVQPCLDYLANPVNHSEPEAQPGIARLKACVEEHIVLLSTLSSREPTSVQVKVVAYQYITNMAATCRYQQLPPERGVQHHPICICSGA
jgi:hypothetical protein